MKQCYRQSGFSLVELVAVMVIVGIVAAVGSSRIVSQQGFQLQGGRDVLVSALFIAQQKAMSQAAPVRLTTAGSQVDIRVDANRDGNFTAAESISIAGQQYPITLPGNVTVSNGTIHYDRLGRTAATTLNVSSASSSVVIRISPTGLAY